MDSRAAVDTLSHLGIGDAHDAVTHLEDGSSVLLRSENGTVGTLLRRNHQYDILIVGSESDCPVPALRAVLETAVLPLSDEYANRIGVALPERDALRKRIREASVALDVIAKGRLLSVSPPKIPANEEIKKHIDAGAMSVDDLPDSFVEDLSLINQLQANVSVWSKEVARVVQTSREGPESMLTAEEETVFWSSLEAALSSAQKALSSREVKIALEILARKRRATGFLLDANNSLDTARRKAAGVLTLIQGLPIVAIRTSENLSSLQKAVESLLEHISAKLRISSFSIERVFSIIHSMGLDVRRSIARILEGEGELLKVPFPEFVKTFQACCELFESWSQGFDHCRKVAREAARKKNETMPPRSRSPLANLQRHLTEIRDVRAEHEAIQGAILSLSTKVVGSRRAGELRAGFQSLVDKSCNLNHCDLNETEKEIWSEARQSYKLAIAGIESELTTEYTAAISDGRDLRSLADRVRPFDVILDKEFMIDATTNAVGDVLEIGMQDLRLLERRCRTPDITDDVWTANSHVMSATLLQSRLLMERAKDMNIHIGQILGKVHAEATPEVKEFLEHVDILRRTVNPISRFQKWLNDIDMNAFRKSLFRLERNSDGNVAVSHSLDSDAVCFYQVLQTAKDHCELRRLITPHHQEFGRQAKANLRILAVLREALMSFNHASSLIADLEELSYLRLFPFLEPVVDFAQNALTEGFETCWDGSASQLKDCSTRVLQACRRLWNTFHILHENDEVLRSSCVSLKILNPTMESGALSQSTSLEVRTILQRVVKVKNTLLQHFDKRSVMQYFSSHYIPLLNDAFTTFAGGVTLCWSRSLSNGGLNIHDALFNVAPGEDGILRIHISPSVEDVEFELILSLSSVSISFLELVEDEYLLLHSFTERTYPDILLHSFRRQNELRGIGLDDPMNSIDVSISSILKAAGTWDEHVDVLQAEIRCSQEPDVNSLEHSAAELERIMVSYEGVQFLREKEELKRKEERRKDLYDARILSAKLLAKLRSELLSNCDHVASASGNLSQSLYKKITETRRLLDDGAVNFSDLLITLQTVKEEVFPSCAASLRVLSSLEEKFSLIVKKMGSTSFACSQSTETWIFAESLQASWKELNDVYRRHHALVMASREEMSSKYTERRKSFQLKLSCLFQDFQSIRNDETKEETFIDSKSLIQDLEHQLILLDKEGLDLGRMARGLNLTRQPEEHGPKDILVELERVKNGFAHLAVIEERLKKMSEVAFSDADPRGIQLEIHELSEKVENIGSMSGASRESQRLKLRIEKVLHGTALISALKSVKLSPPREREFVEKLFASETAFSGLKQVPVALFWGEDIAQHEAYIRTVLENASAEASVCDFLHNIEVTWTRRKCSFCVHDGVSLVQKIPELLDELDEHLQALNTMGRSSHASLFEAERSSWEQRLGNFQEEMVCLAEVQGQWTHLRRLFRLQSTSSMWGLRTELEEEFTAFSNVDVRFSTISERFKLAPGILEGMEGVLGLQTMRTELHGIVRGLSRFLEEQRGRFPRFFFLSDDDLLQVLTTSPSDILSLSSHIRKLFPGVLRLNFDVAEERTTVSGVTSVDGETVQFALPVSIGEGERVSSWAEQVGSSLVRHLKQAMSLALKQFATYYIVVEPKGTAKFEENYLKYPAQVLSLALRCCFTQAIEDCLNDKQRHAGEKMSSISRSIQFHLEAAFFSAENTTCSREDSHRVGLIRSQLIKELVHQKSIVEMLQAQSAVCISSFCWRRNMRVYHENKSAKEEVEIYVYCGLSRFSYGWEYLGVGDVLVHTELTTRCFLTLSESLRRGYGGSPFGPAGTGKTETVKALGRALGRFVAVFNCDESFDAVSVGRILTGVCRLGCWVCFDEFNRLKPGILSSTSGQLASLQTCIRTGRRETENFFGGSLPITVQRGVGVFVTMNPTYTGRSELPANLKTLFRPCAMSKPDSAAIAEVLLLSYGFHNSSSLAPKLVSLFETLEVFVSPQPHYDFGLRSLKSTIMASVSHVQFPSGGPGALKNDMKSEEEHLIRGLEEIVKPKLSSSDLIEYQEVVKSTFANASSMSLEVPDFVRATLTEVLREKGIVPSEVFLEKFRQLYWLIQHQAGVILVGATGSGKSMVWRTLYEVQKRLLARTVDPKRGGSHNTPRSSLTVLDPKLLSMSELYGRIDSVTREWTDGLLSTVLRGISEGRSSHTGRNLFPHHWIVFDGDVDPVWAENLNSVLDDNRILTLPSGEQIPLMQNTRILFETTGLEHANPSTVSRCGMVCFNQERTSFLFLKKSLTEVYLEEVEKDSPQPNLDDISDVVIKAALQVIRAEPVIMLVPLQSIARSMVMTLRSYFAMLDGNRLALEDPTDRLSRQGNTRLASSIVFYRAIVVAAVHALSAGLTSSSRKAISERFVKDAMKITEVQDAFAGILRPPDLSVTSLDSSGNFLSFDARVPKVDPLSCRFEVGDPDLVIPTPSTCRLGSILHSVIRLSTETRSAIYPLVLCGPPGCGKSLLLTSTLKEVPNLFLCTISFSSETSQKDILAALRGYTALTKRPNGSFVLHPKSAGYRVVLFCDEVNLERPDKFGTQRSISLLRSFAEHGGYWDGASARWVALEGICVVAACNPEEDAGRNVLATRFLSHCNVVRVAQPTEDDLKIIYEVFVASLFREICKDLLPRTRDVTAAMVEFFAANKAKFCPDNTGPMLSHYIYSPRELSRWIRGLKQLLVDPGAASRVHLLSAHDSLDESWKKFVSAFCYEARRLFIDRLSAPDERAFSEAALLKIAEQHLAVDSSWLVDCLYTSLADNDLTNISDLVRFTVIRDPERFRGLIYRKLRIFAEEQGLGGSWLTASESSNFEDGGSIIDQFAVTDEVLTHLTRIERVLCNPIGHIVLMGAPGTGKKTLARFAAWMLSMDVHQIHSHSSYSEDDFAQDLRQILRQAGVRGKKVALIFDESHAMGNGFLEVMNSLLACGEVPGLFSTEELSSLLEDLRSMNVLSSSNAATEHTLHKEFIRRVRNNLHIMFTISSSPRNDESFSLSTKEEEDISRRSPALYNRCTVNWVGDWAVESLAAVAELKLEVSLGQEKEEIIRSAVNIHSLTQEEFVKMGSRVKITPRHFLEFIEQVNRLALEKGGEIQAGVERHTEGLKRLRHAGTVVDELKDSLETKSISLQQKEENANNMLSRMMEEQRQAEKSKVDSEQLALAAAEAAGSVKGREDEVADQLAGVQPKVEAAKEAVGAIRKEYLEELRAMPNPPSGVRVALEGVMMVLDAAQKKRTELYPWGTIRSRMRGSEFIHAVVNFDANDLSKRLRRQIEARVLSNPDFDVEKIKYSSRAAGPLAEWTLAVLDFAAVAEAVEPLQAEVLELQQEQLELQDQQHEAREEAKRLEKAIDQCKSQYASLVSEAEKVRQEIKESQVNLCRSEEMLDSLAEEWDRWVVELNRFNAAALCVWGNAVLGAAFIAYAGALDHGKRRILHKKWEAVMRMESIKFEENLEVCTFLTTARKRSVWSSRGLPTDASSLENYAILERSARFPLIVDPSRQSLPFLQRILREHGFGPEHDSKAKARKFEIAQTSFNTTDRKTYMRALESAMRFGTSIVVEDAHEFDRALVPLLGHESSYGDATKFAESLHPVTVEGKHTSKNKNICQRVVRLGERDVFLSPSFRLYMATIDLDSVPSAAITRSNVVSFERSPDALGWSCVSMSIAALFPEIERKRKEFLAAKIENERTKHQLEEQVLSTVNNVDDLGAELLRGSLLRDLSQLKSEVRLLANRKKAEEETSARIKEYEALCAPLGETAVEIFSVLEKLRSVNPLYIFNTSFYLELFRTSVFDSARDVADRELAQKVHHCEGLLLRDVFTEIASRIFPVDRIPFAAALALVTSSARLRNADPSLLSGLRSILKAWHDSVVGFHTDSVSNDDILSKVHRALPREVVEQLSTTLPGQDTESPNLCRLRAVMHVLQTSLQEPHLLRQSIDELACTLPGRESLVHGAKANAEFALQAAIFTYGNSSRAKESLNRSPAPLLLSSRGEYTDPWTLVTSATNKLQLPVISISMGSRASDDSIVDAFSTGNMKAELGDRVVLLLKNMHLASASARRALDTEIKRKDGQLSFLLIVGVEVGADSSVASMLDSVTFFHVLAFEGYPSFRLNFSRAMDIVSSSHAIKSEGLSSCEAVHGRFRVLLAWLHTCLQERAEHLPTGFKKGYGFSDEDLSAAWDVLSRMTPDTGSNNNAPHDAIHLLTQLVYGPRIEEDADFDVLCALAAEIFSRDALESNDQEHVDVHRSRNAVSVVSVPLQKKKRTQFVFDMPLESPAEWVFMPDEAPKRKRILEGFCNMKKILRLGSGNLRDDVLHSNKRFGSDEPDLDVTIQEGLRLPSVLDITCNENEQGPVSRFWAAESSCLRTVVESVKYELAALSGDAPVDGRHAAKISALRKELREGCRRGEFQVPNVWKKTYPVYSKASSLSDFYACLRRAADCLRCQALSNEKLPINLHGVSRPTALLSALKYAESARTGASPHTLHASISGALDVSPGVTLICGVALQGLKWDERAKYFCLSMAEGSSASYALSWNGLGDNGNGKDSGVKMMTVPMYGKEVTDLICSISIPAHETACISQWKLHGVSVILNG